MPVLHWGTTSSYFTHKWADCSEIHQVTTGRMWSSSALWTQRGIKFQLCFSTAVHVLTLRWYLNSSPELVTGLKMNVKCYSWCGKQNTCTDVFRTIGTIWYSCCTKFKGNVWSFSIVRLQTREHIKGEGLKPYGTESETVQVSCYLFISDRVHYKSFFIAFYKKCIIIGSSAFHNYDSYTVDLMKQHLLTEVCMPTDGQGLPRSAPSPSVHVRFSWRHYREQRLP